MRSSVPSVLLKQPRRAPNRKSYLRTLTFVEVLEQTVLGQIQLQNSPKTLKPISVAITSPEPGSSLSSAIAY